MNDLNNNIKSVNKQSQDAMDKAAATAKDGIQSAQKTADQTLNKVADKVDEFRGQAAPVLDKVSDQAQKLLQQGRDSFNDVSQIVREKAVQASDMAVLYTKDEPVKAMLIAAATGALVMSLVSVLARSRD